MRAAAILTECFWPRDPRSTGDIDADIRAELESHVAMLKEQLVRDGASPDEAQREASAQFGDIERYARECRRIDLGDRLWVRRLLSVACLALLAATAALAWQVAESRRTIALLERAEAVDWHERVLSLRDHMQAAFSVGAELVTLPPDEGLAIVRDAWPHVKQYEVKTGLLKAFAFSKPLQPNVHPHVLHVLHLGMTDADAAIRSYARAYVAEYAGEVIADDPQRYSQWFAEHRDASEPELLEMKRRGEASNPIQSPPLDGEG